MAKIEQRLHAGIRWSSELHGGLAFESACEAVGERIHIMFGVDVTSCIARYCKMLQLQLNLWAREGAYLCFCGRRQRPEMKSEMSFLCLAQPLSLSQLSRNQQLYAVPGSVYNGSWPGVVDRSLAVLPALQRSCEI